MIVFSQSVRIKSNCEVYSQPLKRSNMTRVSIVGCSMKQMKIKFLGPLIPVEAPDKKGRSENNVNSIF